MIGAKMVVEVPGDGFAYSYEEMGHIVAEGQDDVSDYRDVQCPSGLFRVRFGPGGWSRAEDIPQKPSNG